MEEVAGPEGPRIECPHCKREVAAGDECPACGIVFEKYRSRQRRPAAGEPEPAPEPPLPLPAETRSAMPRMLLVLLGVSVAIFAYDRSREESATAAAVDAAEAPARAHARAGSASPRKPPTTTRVATGASASVVGQPPAAAPPGSRPLAVQPPRAGTPAAPRADAHADPNEPAEQGRARPTTYSYDWYEGADGFVRGFEEARADGRAIAVYFYTDWCGYCRQLESELLDRAKVENYLKYLTKVKINPESGRAERLIADRYRVTGYPSLFLHPAADRGPTKISGMKRRHGEWKLKTTDEFVESIRRVTGGV